MNKSEQRERLIHERMMWRKQIQELGRRYAAELEWAQANIDALSGRIVEAGK